MTSETLSSIAARQLRLGCECCQEEMDEIAAALTAKVGELRELEAELRNRASINQSLEGFTYCARRLRAILGEEGKQ